MISSGRRLDTLQECFAPEKKRFFISKIISGWREKVFALIVPPLYRHYQRRVAHDFLSPIQLFLSNETWMETITFERKKEKAPLEKSFLQF